MGNEPTNEDRAIYGRHALEAYCQLVEGRGLDSYDGDPVDSLEVAVSDLLNDLMHAVGKQLFEKRLQSARRSYEEEVLEEKGRVPGQMGATRKLNDQQLAQAREMKTKGESVGTIANRFGVSRATMYRYIWGD